jgi:hypothetical protein
MHHNHAQQKAYTMIIRHTCKACCTKEQFYPEFLVSIAAGAFVSLYTFLSWFFSIVFVRIFAAETSLPSKAFKRRKRPSVKASAKPKITIRLPPSAHAVQKLSEQKSQDILRAKDLGKPCSVCTEVTKKFIMYARI